MDADSTTRRKIHAHHPGSIRTRQYSRVTIDSPTGASSSRRHHASAMRSGPTQRSIRCEAPRQRRMALSSDRGRRHEFGSPGDASGESRGDGFGETRDAPFGHASGESASSCVDRVPPGHSMKTGSGGSCSRVGRGERLHSIAVSRP